MSDGLWKQTKMISGLRVSNMLLMTTCEKFQTWALSCLEKKLREDLFQNVQKFQVVVKNGSDGFEKIKKEKIIAKLDTVLKCL